MDDARLEAFLARLYTDAAFLGRFVVGPVEVARAYGLSDGQVQAVAAIDSNDLALAASGFRAKGARAVAASHGVAVRGRWRRWLRWRVRVPILLAIWRLGAR